jgi:hypothetical protein
MRFIRLGFVFLLLAPLRLAAAQTITGQDSTLAGLKRIYIKFDITPGSLDERSQTVLQDAFTLELRKIGIRVLKSTEELQTNQDGIMLVQFAKISRSLVDDAILRIDVRQAVRLERSGRPSFMVTWFYEDNGRNVVVPAFAATAAKKGADDFISRWLDVNGR